jgi:hypothetical protein
MVLTERPYSYLVDSIIPDYIKADFPTYVAFIKKYFEGMSETSGPIEVLYSITKHIDISRVDDVDLYHFIYQYLHSFPQDELDKLDIRQFIQNSKSFYNKKGTLESYQFVFNMLAASLEIYYPSNDIFILNQSSLSGKASYISTIDGDVAEITVVTKIRHRAGINEPCTISGTTNYDGIYVIADIIDDTTFTITSAAHNFAAEAVGVVAYDELHYLHDNYYYAFYVYQITSDMDSDKYKDIVENLVHPIGTKVFYVKQAFDNFLKFHYDEASQYIALF